MNGLHPLCLMKHFSEAIFSVWFSWLSYHNLCLVTKTALVAKSLQCEECIACILPSIQENLEFEELQQLVTIYWQCIDIFISLCQDLLYDRGVAAMSGATRNISGTAGYDVSWEVKDSLLPQQIPEEEPVLGSTWRSSVVGFLWHKILFRNYSDVCHQSVLHIVWLFQTTIMIDSTSWYLLLCLV